MDRLLGLEVWIILDHVDVDDLIQCLISFALTGWFKNLFLITHSFFKGFYYHIITKNHNSSNMNGEPYYIGPTLTLSFNFV